MIHCDEYIEKLHVLYEDNHLIVIEKPINILCQKDDTNDIDINDIVKGYLKKKYNKTGNVYLGLVHRLDRRVGGVLVLAKTSKAAQRLSDDIYHHRWKKQYLVMVEGEIFQDGKLSLCLKKDEVKKRAYVALDGKPSILTYHVLEHNKKHSYLLVDLVSGRFHQIRCSFAYIHHPVVHDYKYHPVKNIRKEEELGLWCYSITILHPITKEEMTFALEPTHTIWNEFIQK